MNRNDPPSKANNSFETIKPARLKRLMYENVGLIYTTLGGLASNVLGALFWLILASILKVDDYGLANYFIAIANVAAGVGIIGLNMTLITYLAKGEKTLLYEANSFTLISGVASALILSIFHWAIGIVAATTIFFNMTLSELLGTKKISRIRLHINRTNNCPNNIISPTLLSSRHHRHTTRILSRFISLQLQVPPLHQQKLYLQIQQPQRKTQLHTPQLRLQLNRKKTSKLF